MTVIFFIINSVLVSSASAAKSSHNGQRIFTDIPSIDFIDPAKFGFHIVLRENFVANYLQPVHQPTIYATAIAVHSSIGDVHSYLGNRSNHQSSLGQLRVSKTLYPEPGDSDDELLDGKAIKLSGLRERTWYYVCVEFESDLRRHERVTGMTCHLKRTLDKFGQNVESIVTEIELIEATDRSFTVRLSVSTDFPLFLHVYLDSDDSNVSPTPPSQTFFLRPNSQTQRLRVFFGPFLQADTLYGKLCVVEEPCAETYTAMGRAVRLTSENCYFNDLKTKPSSKMGHQNKMMRDSPQSQLRNHPIGLARVLSSSAVRRNRSSDFRTMVIFVSLIGAVYR